MSDSPPSLLVVRDLTKQFPPPARGAEPIRAVNGISFEVRAGETLALVGESGCGKSTTGRLILRLIEPTSGQIKYLGENVTLMDRQRLQAYRREAQIIFQDPFSSLNPRMRVSQIIGEPLVVHKCGDTEARRDRVIHLLLLVGLNARSLDRYPHEFSGGQRQRIGIARALALDPKLIVCDEPVSSLDVSVQAQIINLLMDLQNRLGVSYLFIAHNLAVVRHIASQVAVMQRGTIVEMGTTEQVFERPNHPYTRTLLAAIPSLGSR